MRFDGHVVLVTGGARGLGRAFSKAFAALGAKVVINSLGGADEDQPALSAAEVTRQQIADVGGEAVVYDAPVEDAERIVGFCESHYGGLHAIVHCAGIVRDASFAKLNEDDWHAVMSVHLTGAFKLSHAAWPLFRAQSYGRLLFMSSASAIFGNFGQASYSAAKAGMIGLAKSLAVEGSSRNIHCNVIAPLALTRMNRHLLDPSIHDKLSPDSVAPLAVYLCHPDCAENGAIFEAAGGWLARLRAQRGRGVVLSSAAVTSEDIASQLEASGQFDPGESPENIEAALASITGQLP